MHAVVPKCTHHKYCLLLPAYPIRIQHMLVPFKNAYVWPDTTCLWNQRSCRFLFFYHYNAMCSLVHSENKCFILLTYNAGVVPRCKIRSRRIGPRVQSEIQREGRFSSSLLKQTATGGSRKRFIALAPEWQRSVAMTSYYLPAVMNELSPKAFVFSDFWVAQVEFKHRFCHWEEISLSRSYVRLSWIVQGGLK
jgi:hypothetical protein